MATWVVRTTHSSVEHILDHMSNWYVAGWLIFKRRFTCFLLSVCLSVPVHALVQHHPHADIQQSSCGSGSRIESPIMPWGLLRLSCTSAWGPRGIKDPLTWGCTKYNLRITPDPHAALTGPDILGCWAESYDVVKEAPVGILQNVRYKDRFAIGLTTNDGWVCILWFSHLHHRSAFL